MESVVKLIFTPQFFFSIFRLTTPIAFATLACLIAKKAGVRNITIEGTMLCSALAGVVVSAYTQNIWLGVLGGAIAGIPGMFLAIPTIAILKVIFDRIEPLKPWGYLMGDDLPKTYEWRKIRLTNYSYSLQNDVEEIPGAQCEAPLPPLYTESSTHDVNEPKP